MQLDVISFIPWQQLGHRRWKIDLEVKSRIVMVMAKDAFWKYKELLKGNIGLQRKESFTVMSTKYLLYACESWTMNSDLIRRINAFDFEQWCYRRILKINGLIEFRMQR